LQGLTRVVRDKFVYAAAKKNSIAPRPRDVLFRNAKAAGDAPSAPVRLRRIAVVAGPTPLRASYLVIAERPVK
jgi:hypothetical protein